MVSLEKMKIKIALKKNSRKLNFYTSRLNDKNKSKFKEESGLC